MFIWSDGTSYKGEWRLNERFGKGEYFMPDGSKYSGLWKNDLWWGAGVYMNKYGVQFSGVWEDEILMTGEVEVVDLK
mgnify:CR=1 FL=1